MVASRCLSGLFRIQRISLPNVRSKFVMPPRIHQTGFTAPGGFKDEPDVYQSYEQIQEERNPVEAEVERMVNIGFSTKLTNKERKNIKRLQEADIRKARESPELEKAARQRNLKIPLDAVSKDFHDLSKETANAAMHYGMFQDLFGLAYFFPAVPLEIAFNSQVDVDSRMPVYRGNLVSPSDCTSKPDVSYPTDKETLWTLTLLNLDGHLQDNTREYVHWMISNIPGNDLSKGEELVDYIQPLPLRGTGFHRYAFVLFKQYDRISLPSIKVPPASKDLNERTFHMQSFYRQYQDQITPAGLAFFLAEWDESVAECFHRRLDSQDPAFEYEHRPLEHTPQRKYPKCMQPFNLYLDRYRDKREMAEELVKRRLRNLNPFEPEVPKYRWPLVHRTGFNTQDTPSWKNIEWRKEQIGHARFKLLQNPWARWGGVN